MLAGVLGVEVGSAVDIQDHRLAVEHEPLLPDLARGVDEGSASPVVAAPRDQPHAVAVALQAAVSVDLNFVQTVRAGRRAGRLGG